MRFIFQTIYKQKNDQGGKVFSIMHCIVIVDNIHVHVCE